MKTIELWVEDKSTGETDYIQIEVNNLVETTIMDAISRWIETNPEYDVNGWDEA